MNIRDKIKHELFEVEREGMSELVVFLEDNGFFKVPASKNNHLNIKTGLAKHSWNVFQYHKMFADYFGLLNPNHPEHINLDSLRIEGLLHDITKLDEYSPPEISASQNKFLSDLIKRNDRKIDKNDVVFIEGEEKYLEIKIENEYLKLTSKSTSLLIDWLKGDTKKPRAEDIKKANKENGWDYADDSFPLVHGSKSVIVLQDFIKLKKREKLAIYWHMSCYEKGVSNDYVKMGKLSKAGEMYPDVKLLQLADQTATFIEDRHDLFPDNYKEFVPFVNKKNEDLKKISSKQEINEDPSVNDNQVKDESLDEDLNYNSMKEVDFSDLEKELFSD
jgi:hypothetical protein